MVVPQGGMNMRRFTICCVCAVLGISAARSGDEPKSSLKNVSLVSYVLLSGAKDRCAINVQAWNTAIDFVANQSSKLKLIRQNEHDERSKELMDEARRASRKFMATNTDAEEKVSDEALEKFRKYNAAPTLLLVVEGLEHNGSCFGHLSAAVSAMLKPSEMMATRKLIIHPHEEIWSTSKLLAASPNTFFRFVIETSEEMVKSFVNDWALTQREYAD
jgi:hypothetical protein